MSSPCGLGPPREAAGGRQKVADPFPDRNDIIRGERQYDRGGTSGNGEHRPLHLQQPFLIVVGRVITTNGKKMRFERATDLDYDWMLKVRCFDQ